ncbi:MAG: hypothetical protein KA715_11035 [Xanthomonadaceae bacterium]|nr:hypothetical protein [Xanthomonadaceae bacterium]
MLLADFLGEFLGAHAEALGRLSSLMSDDIVVQLMEDERTHTPSTELKQLVDQVWNPKNTILVSESPYMTIEQWVRQHRIGKQLEFYVWAYPAYRMIIESALTPESNSLLKHDDKKWDELFAACRNEGIEWIKSQKLDEPLHTASLKSVDLSWVKFRANMLKRLGRRTLSQV